MSLKRSVQPTHPTQPKVAVAAFVALLAPILAGCPASSDEVKPPSDQFYFPTGMALNASQTDLYVVNANSDLRFDSGVLSVLNVGLVADIITAWDSGTNDRADCSPDESISTTLICDETALIDSARSVRIGNFATEVGAQTLESGATRLFVAVRGDPSLTYVDVLSEGAPLNCEVGGSTFHECDEEFRLVRLRDNDDLPLIPDEPFGIYVDSAAGFVMTTHLSNGAVALAAAPPDGSPPVLSDAIAGIFTTPGLRPGAVGIAGRQPGTDNDRIYVTSRTESRVQTLLVTRIGNRLPEIVAGEFFFINKVVPSSDSRDIEFSSDGNRAFVINRDPPSLQVLDTSMAPTGVPRHEFVGAVEMCRQAATMELVGDGSDERLYVSCFRDGELWVVNPNTLEIEAIINVGNGPQYVVAADSVGLLFVSNFRENTIAVIDIRPGSVTANRVVLRVGRPGETTGVE